MNRSEEAIERYWPEFTSIVRGRLKVGAAEYGDSTLDRPILEVIREIEEELADVMGWGFFAYLRLQKIKESLTQETATNTSA